MLRGWITVLGAGTALSATSCSLGMGRAIRHVRASLVSEVESLKPGQSFWVGLRLEMAKGWHTSWRNPGDSGQATRVAWTLPSGFEAGPLVWPAPERIPVGPLVNYGYQGEILLLAEITPPPTIPESSVVIGCRMGWLECQEACLPGRADLAIALPVRAESPQPSEKVAALFREARRLVPVEAGGWTVERRGGSGESTLFLRPPEALGPPPEKAYFFPDVPQVVDHAASQNLRGEGRGWGLEIVPDPNARRPLGALTGVLVVQAAGARRALQIGAGWRTAPSVDRSESEGRPRVPQEENKR